MRKKILILGNSAKEYALAQVLSIEYEVFVAPGNDAVSDIATCVDIRENDSNELLEFVKNNNIDLTIPVSDIAIKSSIVNDFQNNGLNIFAANNFSSKIIFDKAYAKKILYKLRIPTPKFGIFEKQNMALEYIKNLKEPYVIKTNEPSSAVIFTSPKLSKSTIDSMFTVPNQKVIIEDYVYGTPFAFYTITDGYKALPIGSSIIYKHSLEGDGGQLTTGMGACSPNYKLSNAHESYIMDNVIYPTLDFLEIEGTPYVGILGVNGILTEDGSIKILGYLPFMQHCDCTAILQLLDCNIIDLMKSCIIGSFSDEVEYIPQKEFSAVSLVLSSTYEKTNNVIAGLDCIDDIFVDYYNSVRKNKYLEYEANKGSVIVLTAINKTTSKALERIYETAQTLSFQGKSYRKDIGGLSTIIY